MPLTRKFTYLYNAARDVTYVSWWTSDGVVVIALAGLPGNPSTKTAKHRHVREAAAVQLFRTVGLPLIFAEASGKPGVAKLAAVIVTSDQWFETGDERLLAPQNDATLHAWMEVDSSVVDGALQAFLLNSPIGRQMTQETAQAEAMQAQADAQKGQIAETVHAGKTTTMRSDADTILRNEYGVRR